MTFKEKKIRAGEVELYEDYGDGNMEYLCTIAKPGAKWLVVDETGGSILRTKDGYRTQGRAMQAAKAYWRAIS